MSSSCTHHQWPPISSPTPTAWAPLMPSSASPSVPRSLVSVCDALWPDPAVGHYHVGWGLVGCHTSYVAPPPRGGAGGRNAGKFLCIHPRPPPTYPIPGPFLLCDLFRRHAFTHAHPPPAADPRDACMHYARIHARAQFHACMQHTPQRTSCSTAQGEPSCVTRAPSRFCFASSSRYRARNFSPVTCQ